MDLEQYTRVPCVALDLPAVPASVTTARDRVRDFAARQGAGPWTLTAIALAVSEAVGNAVRHAYADEPGEVQVMLDVEEDELELVVMDDGQGFTTRPVNGMGLGLAVMREVCDAFEVRDRPLGGVEVWMRFALG